MNNLTKQEVTAGLTELNENQLNAIAGGSKECWVQLIKDLFGI